MPYSSNSDLPESVRSKYSDRCQSVFRNVWNSVYERTKDEERAFASAHSRAQKCEGSKEMTDIYTAQAGTGTFKIFAPMLKAFTSDDGRRRLHGVASSTIKDKHGDTMTLSALSDMERAANNNLTIFLNHEYKVPEDVAGTVERAIIRSHPEDQAIHDLELDILINESNPRAVSAWDAIQSGTKLGLSIGATIPDGGATRDKRSGTFTIDHLDLLETSLVGVPANPRSWVEYAVKSLRTAFKDIEEDEEPVDEVAEEISEETPEVEEAAEEVAAETISTSNSANSWTLQELTVTDSEPDVTDATVNIETPFANISIDTGNRGKTSAGESSQEAPESEPENEDAAPENPWSAVGLASTPLPDTTASEEEIDALAALSPAVVASLKSQGDLLREITSELIETRSALEQARSERDEAVKLAYQALGSVNDVVNRLADTPIGKRSVYREAASKLDSLRDVYGDKFVSLLNKE